METQTLSMLPVKYSSVVAEVNNLSVYDKMDIWLAYYARMLKIKLHYQVIEKDPYLTSLRDVFNGTKLFVKPANISALLNIKDKHISFNYDEKTSWRLGYGEPFFENAEFALYRLGQDVKIKTFNEFISADNLKISVDENWEKNGRAQACTVEMHGIYEWYWKLKIPLKK